LTPEDDAHVALAKHACPACGAQAEWRPEKRALVCPSCGTQSPYEIDASGAVREIPLAQALREMPDDARGWQTETRSVRCRSCRAVSVFAGARVGQRCEFCGSPEIVDYEEVRAPIRPESLLPFKLGQADARDRLRGWIRGRWFAPNSLSRRALVDTVHGVYIPYWTFDARADCDWTAESGTYYYTTETYRDAQGRRLTRQKRHVRWRPASGSLQHVFDDQPIPGTTGIDRELLRGIEPWPTAELKPYDTAYLSGFVVEHYQLVLLDAAKQARQGMDETLRQLCAAQVPGDTQRNLVVDARYSAETFKHVLVPIWLLTYDWGRRPWQVLVNGYTGVVAGRYPKSFWKIALLVLALAVAAGLVALVAASS
jgi:hypothetical protein